jgi:hypothetical protein
MRRFPAPWTVEAIDAGFEVVDANKPSARFHEKDIPNFLPISQHLIKTGHMELESDLC